MRNRAFFFFFFISLGAFMANAQINDPKEISLKDLQAPSSPAFILLDAAPTSIEQPATSKAFVMSIINSFAENNGIPENYAVEFTPFWFLKHPGFTSYKYYGLNKTGDKQHPFASMKMTAVSLAFLNKPAQDTLVPKTSNLSFGLRTTLFKVMSSKDRNYLVELDQSLASRLREHRNVYSQSKIQIEVKKELINKLKTRLLTLQDPLKRYVLEDSLKIQTVAMDSLKQVCFVLINAASTDPVMVSLEDNIRNVLSRKPVFAIDGAAAINWSFNNNDFASNQLDRFGAWLNFDLSLPLSDSKKEKKSYLSFYLSGRYLSGRLLNDANTITRQDLFDSGGKLELEFDRLIISGEYLYRYNFTEVNDHTFRASGLVKYKITESLYLTGAFGRNFGDANNLISQIGINWGFGSGNEEVLPLSK